MIQTLGRWHSAAFLRYIRTPKARLASTSVTLVQQARTVHDVLCTLLSSSPHVVMVTHSHHLSVILNLMCSLICHYSVAYNLIFVISKLLETYIPHRSVCSNNGGGGECHALDVGSDS